MTPLDWTAILTNGWLWFNILLLFLLAVDLGVFNRKAHTIGLREAILLSIFWIMLALLFNLWIWHTMGTLKAQQYLAGYVLEKCLSVDNIFVFVLIFSYFKVPSQYQHKVLFWGILSALVLRAVFIFAGAAALKAFEEVGYLFGAFLIWTGIKMFTEKDKELHPEKNPVIRWVRRWAPVTSDYRGSNFVVRENGKLSFTPLLIVLLVVETTDVLFAVDSIPAILTVTQDEFIVYTSNAFAILGLRALYFAVGGLMRLFHYLSFGLSIVLVYIGVKMILQIHDFFKIPITVSLIVVFSVVGLSVIASLIFPPKPEEIGPEEFHAEEVRPHPFNLDELVESQGAVPANPTGSGDNGLTSKPGDH